MQNSYHKEASFYDPVFELLPPDELRAMWQMLLTRAQDLKIEYRNVSADDYTGKCHWEAWYTFAGTGRKVHNIVDSSFEFKGGRIFTHHDQFDVWRWAKMALGPGGYLLGWSPVFIGKLRKKARSSLQKFMAESKSGVPA